MNTFWLAIEGGGTHTRVLLVQPDGKVVLRRECVSGSPLYVRTEPGAQGGGFQSAFFDIAHEAAARATEAGGRVAAVGVAAPLVRPLVEQILHATIGRVPVLTFSEGDIALAVSGLHHGACVVAGTGSSAFCIDESGVTISCGGFGPQFDDGGSAYWIAREGMAAIARAADGRGPTTALKQIAFDHFELTDHWDVMSRTGGHGFIAANILAGFARKVARAAEQGDEVALHIMRSAGEHLADLVAAAVRQSVIAVRPVPVVPAGGVFRAGGLVWDPMRDRLAAIAPACALQAPVVEPEEGIAIRMREALHVS